MLNTRLKALARPSGRYKRRDLSSRAAVATGVRSAGVSRPMGHRFPNLIRRMAREEGGASAVEFALVSIPFIAFLLAALQTSIILFMGDALQTATQKASRVFLTGQAASQNMTQAQFTALVCSNLPNLFQGTGGNCPYLLVDVESANSFSSLNTATITPTYNADGTPNYTGNFNFGAAGSAVIVRVMYNWPAFNLPLGFSLQDQANGTFLLIGTAIFQNEPYSSAS
jgi:Flp pilus assembly protein TadG